MGAVSCMPHCCTTQDSGQPVGVLKDVEDTIVLPSFAEITRLAQAPSQPGEKQPPGTRLDTDKASTDEVRAIKEAPLGNIHRPSVLQGDEEEAIALKAKVLNLIDVEWPKLKNSSLLSTWKERDQMIREIGPPMMLVDPEMIKTLGRIPHSCENKTISMEEAFSRAEKEGKRFFIEMFSHTWHSRNEPDCKDNKKAMALMEWAKYRDSMNFRTFYWIDQSCIDQGDIGPGVAMLPLYVSCCNNILCYDTPAYEPRAWCRLERLLFSSFVAPNNEYILPDFKYTPNAPTNPNGELIPESEGKALVPDPSSMDAQLSYPADEVLISELKDLCTTHWAKCWKDGLMEVVEEKVGLQDVRTLMYGGTQLRLRRFR